MHSFNFNLLGWLRESSKFSLKYAYSYTTSCRIKNVSQIFAEIIYINSTWLRQTVFKCFIMILHKCHKCLSKTDESIQSLLSAEIAQSAIWFPTFRSSTIWHWDELAFFMCFVWHLNNFVQIVRKHTLQWQLLRYGSIILSHTAYPPVLAYPPWDLVECFNFPSLTALQILATSVRSFL